MTNRTNPSSACVRRTKTPLVIGIGAPFRGDDEIGLIVAKALRAGQKDIQADFASHSDDPARIMDEWSGRESVLVIDAIRAGSEPGVIHRIEVNDTDATPQSRTSSHGNALRDAIELSRALDLLPENLIAIGMEPENVGIGEKLSPACQRKLPELVELARKEVSCMNRL